MDFSDRPEKSLYWRMVFDDGVRVISIDCSNNAYFYHIVLQEDAKGSLTIGSRRFIISIKGGEDDPEHQKIINTFTQILTAGDDDVSHIKNRLAAAQFTNIVYYELKDDDVIQLLEESVGALCLVQSSCLPRDVWSKIYAIITHDAAFLSAIKYLEAKMGGMESFSIPRLASDYGTDIQDQYSTRMHVHIHLGAIYKKKYGLTFPQMLTFFSCMRLEIALTLTGNFSANYGLPRTSDSMTRLTSVYEEIPTRIREKYPDIASQAFYQTTAILDQKEIMLSNIAINSSIHVLIHTSPVHIANILTHVEKLYELAHSSTDKEAIVRLSGEIFWWICQAKPWYLGDPSIAEMLIRSLWEEKGIENVAWNPSIIPWVETIVEIDVKKFGEKFPSLFIRPII